MKIHHGAPRMDADEVERPYIPPGDLAMSVELHDIYWGHDGESNSYAKGHVDPATFVDAVAREWGLHEDEKAAHLGRVEHRWGRWIPSRGEYDRLLRDAVPGVAPSSSPSSSSEATVHDQLSVATNCALLIDLLHPGGIVVWRCETSRRRWSHQREAEFWLDLDTGISRPSELLRLAGLW